MRPVAVALFLLSIVGVARADWEVKRSPFDPRVVARYRAALHEDPTDADAWKRLAALYRTYRSLAELERECQAAADRSGDARDRLLVGHARRERGDTKGAIAAYEAA